LTLPSSPFSHVRHESDFESSPRFPLDPFLGIGQPISGLQMKSKSCSSVPPCTAAVTNSSLETLFIFAGWNCESFVTLKVGQ
jgi:hypothetical protein